MRSNVRVSAEMRWHPGTKVNLLGHAGITHAARRPLLTRTRAGLRHHNSSISGPHGPPLHSVFGQVSGHPMSL